MTTDGLNSVGVGAQVHAASVAPDDVCHSIRRYRDLWTVVKALPGERRRASQHDETGEQDQKAVATVHGTPL